MLFILPDSNSSGIKPGAFQIGSEPLLRQLKCPKLSVFASPERVATASLMSLQPLSRTTSWTPAGHWLHQERPEHFNEVLDDWIAHTGI
jgi:pimeloyl-ACP methyl ester carboxylesterase